MKHRILYALLSAVIAFGLWIYVITVDDPEYEDKIYNIPVVLDGEVLLNERGLMITDEQIPEVTLKVSGSRSDILKLNSSNVTLLVDISRINEPGVKKLSFEVLFPGDVPNNAINVLERSPDSVTITVEERKDSKIPVKVNYNDTKVPPDYMADKLNAILDYEQIPISGPASVINQISYAEIEVDLTNKTETISQRYKYTLYDASGEPIDAKVASMVETSVTDIKLTLHIQMVKTIDLIVNVLSGGGATADNSQIIRDPLTIQVAGSEKLLKDLNELVVGTINLGEYLDGEKLEFEINLPDGVTNLSGYDKVTVSLGFPNLSTKKLEVTNFKAVNVPAGMIANISKTKMEVIVRGPQALINLITPEDITLSVDFMGAESGISKYNVDVLFDARFDGVGALYTYDVVATLTEITGEV